MSISFKVTVEVVLPNMIDREALDKEFNGNLRKALEFILDGEKVVGFSDSETIIKIEESDTPKQDGVAISSWAATGLPTAAAGAGATATAMDNQGEKEE